MIICNEIEFSDFYAQEIGRSCQSIDFITHLDSLITMQTIYPLLYAQWGVYALLLSFAWSKYVIKNHMKT